MRMALIIALICLLVGALLVGASWVYLQKNPIDKNTVKDSVYRYTLDEVPTQINILTLSSNVVLCPIEGDEWRVECMDKEDLYHTVELNDGVLTIKQIDNRKWFNHIDIFNGFQNLSVIVRLPAQVYESLNAHTVSGIIKVEEGFTFSNASLQSTSGDMSFASVTTGTMNIKVISGDIAISGNIGGSLKISGTSGDLALSGNVGGAVEISGTSGDVEIKNATPTSITIQNTSGDIELIDVVCRESCAIEKTSGSVELRRCDALSFNIVTTSGDIYGSLLSAKTFDCHTTSGDVHTPADGNGGTFRAKTTSGDIKITVLQ